MIVTSKTGSKFGWRMPSQPMATCSAVRQFSSKAVRIFEAVKFGSNLIQSRFVVQMAAKVVIFETKFEYRPFTDHF